MQLYLGSVAEFESQIADGSLIPQLKDAYSRKILNRPSDSEVRSWERSLAAVASETQAVGVPDAGIIVEHMLPLSSKRLDVMLFGTAGSGEPKPLVLELKQWTGADVSEVDETLVNLGGRLALHPQVQVGQYVQYLRDFHPSVYEGGMDIAGAVYLHDARDAEIDALRRGTPASAHEFPLFTAENRDELQELLAARLAGPGVEVMREFVAERTRPSKKLLEHVAAEIEGNPRFELLDEQLVAFEATRKAVERARAGVAKNKCIVIVTGGPGSGKSVIATRMLGDFAKRGWNVSHATGSRAFTSTLRKIVGNRAGQVFRYFNQFMDAEQDELDVLICDEAHRIRHSSNNRFTPKHKRSDIPQVHELIQVARVPVFLLDENQAVRPDEIGRVSVIEQAAEEVGAEVIRIDLTGQFRCGGSVGYTQWLDRLLGLEPGGPIPWTNDDFELVVVDSPQELEAWLQEKQTEVGGTGRIAAGYCWPWSDPDPNGQLIEDVVIGEWRRPWNAKPGKRVKGAPESHYWATDPRGFGQVGCIYTAQGFEYDWGAVIIGPDLKWTGNGWYADREASADNVVRRSRDFDLLVRHTYKVLLTRGLRGCAVYALDQDTQEFLRNMVG